MPITLDHLRRYAIARSLFKPTTLQRAIKKLGFVQADPIRAPARAQDLTLRHRVLRYHAGDLERRYPRLGLEEDYFVNYGFLGRQHHALMHPRTPRDAWSPRDAERAAALLAFIRKQGIVHPREVDAHFAHGKVRNWFGGATNASTHLLDAMQYRGLLRVARRVGGTRLYAARELPVVAAPQLTPAARMDALVDLAVHQYAPLLSRSLGLLLSYLCGGVPQWIPQRAAALTRARQRLAHARIDGRDWFWPAAEQPSARRWRLDDQVRLLTPFDPVVWDRRRFAQFWGWEYRFEAYTPPRLRKLGYYALPLLWRGVVIGWGNVAVRQGVLQHDFGFVAGQPPRDPAFRGLLDAELDRLRTFLAIAN